MDKFLVKFSQTLTGLLILTFSGSSFAITEPESWIQIADQVRNPSQSYEMKIKVEDADTRSILQVFLKGQDKTLIVTKEPASDQGRNMLMLDRDFHAYVPNLKRTMRLSLAQKLSGQVANGDISRTRWYGDYSVQLEKETETEHQLLLKAKKENLTYSWIRLWLKKTNHYPIRAEFLNLTGKKILKKASFENYKQIAGAERPTTMRIVDTDGKTSFIRILSMQSKAIPDSFFTTRNMESLK